MWLMVEEKVECTGNEVTKGRLNDVESCAKSCKDTSSMFIFGSNDFGAERCYANGCECACETSALSDGTCTTTPHNGYRLYKYKWWFLEDKVECNGEEVTKGRLHDIESCAKSCKDISSMFIYGTNDFDEDRCYAEGCECSCETSALSDGTRTTTPHNGYRLYKYV